MKAINADEPVYEIIQALPAPDGWWLKYKEDGKSYYEKPLCLALIECRWQTSKAKYVGGIDATGQVADDTDNYHGLVYSTLNLAECLPVVVEL